MERNMNCPECGSADVTVRIQTDVYKLLAGDSELELRASFPMHTCAKCAYGFLTGGGSTRVIAAFNRLADRMKKERP